MEKRLIALNTKHFADKRKNNRGYAETQTSEQFDELLRQEWLRRDVADIRAGREEKKDWLPFICPHYTAFKDNHRAQDSIIPEAFTFMTCVDIDNPKLVRQAFAKALEVNKDEQSEWYDMVLREAYSARGKGHIYIRIPKGMTIEEAQRAFCEELGFNADELLDASCFTPERYIYVTGIDQEVFRSEHWLEPIEGEELEERREAYRKRGMREDGRKKTLPLPLPVREGSDYSQAAQKTDSHASQKTDSHASQEADSQGSEVSTPFPVREGSDYSQAAQKTDSQVSQEADSQGSKVSTPLPYREGQGGESSSSSSPRTLFIFDACMKEAELSPEVLIVKGHRHEALKSILSVGATQLLKKEELLGVLKVRMPDNWQDENIQTLVNDFYAKYHDDSQKMTAFQRKTLARSLKADLQTPPRPLPIGRGGDSLGGDGNYSPPSQGGVGGESSFGEAGRGPLPMPKRLPALIKLLTSKTPDIYKPAVAHAVFPSLAAHLWKVRFRYIDNVEHEATLMNVLMAGTGAGKDCISQPINRIMADIRLRDAENLKREAEWKREVNSKGSNKDKRQRPEGLVIQEVDPDMTNPAFVMRMAEADEHFLYTKMNEIDQFDALRGSARGSQQFQIMCLAFDPDNRYGQTRVGTQSVTEKVCIRFNWNAATTIQKGQRYFSRVLTDGPISRINFCTIPEREIGADMPVYGTYDSAFDEELRPYIERLTRASGVVDCPQAFRLAKKLKDECAEFSRLSQSRVYENLSFRANVIAWLKGCVLYICNDYRWSKEIEDFVRWSLKYDLWCKMQFFGAAIEAANQEAEHTPKRGPRNLLELLPDEFTLHDAELVRQAQGLDTKGTNGMLRQWVHRGYALRVTDDSYKKVKSNK